MHQRRGGTQWAVTLMAVGALIAGCANEKTAGTPPAASPTLPTTRSSTLDTVPISPTPIPPISDDARAIGLIDVRDAVADSIVDLRYSTPNNFVGVALYPADARCLVDESLGPGLEKAQAALREGEVLVFWDCYRPHSVQLRMFETVPNPAWVAAPGPYSRGHESGRSVDVSVAARLPECPSEREIAGRCLVDMGTDLDSFTPAAGAFAEDGVPVEAQQARSRLRAAMATGGLSVYDGEWWHFDGVGAEVERPIIDVPLT